MRKKHWKKLFITAMAYLFAFSSVSLTNTWAATTGHFTDLLPNPTSINSASVTSGELYYNGYDWTMVTLAPSQTPGDAIARGPFTAYQIYVTSTVANTTNVSTFTALTGSASVGSTTIPAAWIASGRTIRITAKGKYGTTGTPNWTWGVLLGTTTILNTGAVAAPTGQTQQNTFSATALLTVSTTGALGTVNGTYDIFVGSTTGSTTALVNYSTNTASAVAVDLTSQLTINPTFTWGSASASNTITFINVLIELLN